MPLPEALITLAIVGTENSGHPLPHVAPALQTLLAQVDTVPERQMLLAIVGLDLRQRAGWLAPHIDCPRIAHAPTDTQPLIAGPALRQLYVMLKGVYSELLGEWLAKVAASGQRVPEEVIPFLLELGKQNKSFHESILVLVGERGKWLAHQAPTPAWLWFEPYNFERRWQHSPLETRLKLLEFMLPTARAEVRERLRETWATEKVSAKVAFIQLLLEGLSLADEPFLESCLDDALAEVRAKAATLLAQLEGSAYQQRAIERLRPFLHPKSPLQDFEIIAPQEWQAEWGRDGIAPFTVPYLLAQLLSFVPPQHLCDYLNTDIPALLEWCLKKKFVIDFWEHTHTRWIRYQTTPRFSDWLLQHLPADIPPAALNNLMRHVTPALLLHELPSLIKLLSHGQVDLLFDQLPTGLDIPCSYRLMDWVDKVTAPEGGEYDLRLPGNSYKRYRMIKVLVWLAHVIHLNYADVYSDLLVKIFWEEKRIISSSGQEYLVDCQEILGFRQDIHHAIYTTAKDKQTHA